MIDSRTCEYAMRALVYFADHPEEKSATVKDVSEESGLSISCVAKIFQCLAREWARKTRLDFQKSCRLFAPTAIGCGRL